MNTDIYGNWNTCLYHSKTLLVRQGTFLFKAWPDSAVKRDILITGNLDISGIWYWKSVHWWIVYHQWKQNIAFFKQWNIHRWEEKEKRIGKLKINGIVSRSVINLSSRTQESAFWADLLIVSSSLETFDSFDELLSSLEITDLKFSTSELLITSEIVKHWTIFHALILWILTSNHWDLRISWVTVRRKHQLYHQVKVQLVRQQHHPKPWKQECKQI